MSAYHVIGERAGGHHHHSPPCPQQHIGRFPFRTPLHGAIRPMHLDQLPDRHLDLLLLAAPAGQRRDVFEAWCRRHDGQAAGRARETLRRAGAPEHLAPDSVQQAKIRFWARLDHLHPDLSPLYYYLCIVANAARDQARRERRHASRLHLLHAAAAGPLLADAELREVVEALLRRLPALQRRLVVGHYLEGWSAEELGEREGLAVSQVYRHLHAARTRLRSVYGQGEALGLAR